MPGFDAAVLLIAGRRTWQGAEASWTGAMVSAVTLAAAAALGEPIAGAPPCPAAQVAAACVPAPGAEGSSAVVAGAVELRDALAAARPGAEILIAPGATRCRSDSTRPIPETAGRPVVVRARDALGLVVIDGAGASITIKFSGAAHVEIRDPGGHRRRPPRGVLRSWRPSYHRSPQSDL